MNVKNGASTSLQMGTTEQLLWGVDDTKCPGSSLEPVKVLEGVQGLASALTLLCHEPLSLQSGLRVFSRLSVCRDLPNRFFKVALCCLADVYFRADDVLERRAWAGQGAVVAAVGPRGWGLADGGFTSAGFA